MLCVFSPVAMLVQLKKISYTLGLELVCIKDLLLRILQLF